MAKKTSPPVQSASEENGTKGSALAPMYWLIGGLATPATAGVFVGPTWYRIWLLILLSMAVIAFIGQNIYFGMKKPDMLRSEHYNLKKLMLSRLGDDKHGFHDIRVFDDDVPQQAIMVVPSDKEYQLPQKEEN